MLSSKAIKLEINNKNHNYNTPLCLEIKYISINGAGLEKENHNRNFKIY